MLFFAESDRLRQELLAFEASDEGATLPDGLAIASALTGLVGASSKPRRTWSMYRRLLECRYGRPGLRLIAGPADRLSVPACGLKLWGELFGTAVTVLRSYCLLPAVGLSSSTSPCTPTLTPSNCGAVGGTPC